MLLAEKLAADGQLKGSAFNFSNEQQITVLELVELLLRKLNSSLSPIVQNQVSNEIRSQYLSSAKARRILGWKPLFTLEEGLDRTISWYREVLGNA
jgi:CDP-glucose 4,6-dehydratase